MNKSNPYRENLLHWIWGNQYFDITNLTTLKGQRLQVYDTGTLNYSDGPDFQNACIQIGPLKWYGDVEIHWNEKDWNKHHHQSDTNFNNVILHVVYYPVEKSQTYREDGSKIPTLFLEPVLQHPLRQFLEQSQSADTLPCANQFTYISEEAFEQQLKKAHKEYFEKKVADLMPFYDPSLPVTIAWQNLTAIALFDGLGISQNREPMQQLSKVLLEMLPKSDSLQEFINKATMISGVNDNSASQEFDWKHKGSRPCNHPKIRVKQGAALLWHLKNSSIKEFITSEPLDKWNNLNAQIQKIYSVGQERKKILYGTVWLPSIFMLGNLLHAKKLKTSAWQNWKEYSVKLPKSILRPLKSLPIAEDIYSHKLGSIHQLRNYCKPRQCKACKVFKSVISA